MSGSLTITQDQYTDERVYSMMRSSTPSSSNPVVPTGLITIDTGTVRNQNLRWLAGGLVESERELNYGTSLHYAGEKGQEYLAWQNATGTVAGIINAKKFSDINFSNSTVVDFGAGAGNLLSAIKANRKIAVEINPHAHEVLAAKGQEFVPTLQELPPKIADYIISNHALEHVPYPINALQEINRVLKPGGLLRMYLPIDDWRTQKQYRADDINHHLSTWTPQLIGNCLQEAGFIFGPRDIRVVTHAWPPGYARIYMYPGFDSLCKAFSFVRRRRQLSVTARKASG